MLGLPIVFLMFLMFFLMQYCKNCWNTYKHHEIGSQHGPGWHRNALFSYHHGVRTCLFPLLGLWRISSAQSICCYYYHYCYCIWFAWGMLFSMVALCFYIRAYAHAAFSSWVCGEYPLLNQYASTTTTIVIIGMVFGLLGASFCHFSFLCHQGVCTCLFPLLCLWRVSSAQSICCYSYYYCYCIWFAWRLVFQLSLFVFISGRMHMPLSPRGSVARILFSINMLLLLLLSYTIWQTAQNIIHMPSRCSLFSKFCGLVKESQNQKSNRFVKHK